MNLGVEESYHHTQNSLAEGTMLSVRMPPEIEQRTERFWQYSKELVSTMNTFLDHASSTEHANNNKANDDNHTPMNHKHAQINIDRSQITNCICIGEAPNAPPNLKGSGSAPKTTSLQIKHTRKKWSVHKEKGTLPNPMTAGGPSGRPGKCWRRPWRRKSEPEPTEEDGGTQSESSSGPEDPAGNGGRRTPVTTKAPSRKGRNPRAGQQSRGRPCTERRKQRKCRAVWCTARRPSHDDGSDGAGEKKRERGGRSATAQQL